MSNSAKSMEPLFPSCERTTRSKASTFGPPAFSMAAGYASVGIVKGTARRKPSLTLSNERLLSNRMRFASNGTTETPSCDISVLPFATLGLFRVYGPSPCCVISRPTIVASVHPTLIKDPFVFLLSRSSFLRNSLSISGKVLHLG